MSNKHFKALKELTVEELNTKIRETEASLFKTKMQLATGQLENTSGRWVERKNLARMKMLLGQKTKAPASAAPAK